MFSKLFLALLIIWPVYVTFNVGVARLGLPQAVGMLYIILQVMKALTLPRWTAYYAAAAKSAPILGATIVLMIAFRFISSSLGESPGLSLVATIRDVTNIVIALIFGIRLASSRAAVNALGLTIVTTSVIISVAGIFETISSQLIANLLNLSSHIPSIDDSLNSIFVDKYREGRLRAQVTFLHPIVFSQFIGASVPFFLSYMKVSRPFVSSLLALALLLVIAALFCSGSRSGYFVFATSVGSYVILRLISLRKIRVEHVIILVGIAILFIFLKEFFMNLFIGSTREEMMSTELRDLQFKLAFDQIMFSPLFGFGAGMATAKAGVISRLGDINYHTLDNLYLSYLLNYGIFGLTTFCIAVILSLIGGMRLLRQGLLPGQEKAGCAMLASILALLVGFYIVSIDTNVVLIYFFAGIFIGLRSRYALGFLEPTSEFAFPIRSRLNHGRASAIRPPMNHR